MALDLVCRPPLPPHTLHGMSGHQHLKRLDRIWITNPVYFITACTHGRKSVLASTQAAGILLREWRTAKDRHGWLIGRYVVMPDHVHFFCSERPMGSLRPLPRFINKWKEWTAKGIRADVAVVAPLWQRGYFDHVLRSEESYAEKWAYVRDNPVRAGLASAWEKWPWQGFVDFDLPR